MSTRLRLRLQSAIPALLLAVVPTACDDDAATASATGDPLASVGLPAGMHRQYGTPVAVGQGRVRSYVVLDQKRGGAAVEFGVAFDERAMQGLPAHGHGGGPHGNMLMYDIPAPAQNPTAFQFVELDWNPGGHEPPGIYDVPHFDFHFYTATKAERAAIDPSDPAYAAKAAHEPAVAARPPFFINPATAFGIPAHVASIPRMGMHWIDPRSPELQGMTGHPERYRPFTHTFIYGAWDGRFTFMEPMITRAHILAKRDATDPAVRDEVVPIPTSSTYPAGGFRPDAYRIAWGRAGARVPHRAHDAVSRRAAPPDGAAAPRRTTRPRRAARPAGSCRTARCGERRSGQDADRRAHRHGAPDLLDLVVGDRDAAVGPVVGRVRRADLAGRCAGEWVQGLCGGRAGWWMVWPPGRARRPVGGGACGGVGG
jgi:hypothetical protein